MPKLSGMKHRAVFLDRDGTINRDVGFPDSFDRIEIFPGSIRAVRALNRVGLLAVIVTNQSGVARGLIPEAALDDIHRRMREAFSREGARIDAIYYCPHHPDAALPRYRAACRCRKPEPGMALQAAGDLDIELSRSYMIGDKEEDILFGFNFGAVPILVQTGYGRESLPRLESRGRHPAYVASDLEDAVNWVLEREAPAGSRP